MKKVIFGLLDLLSVVFLIGGYVVQYYTKRKLGMVRWVNYHEMKIRKAVPIDILKYAVAVAVLILAILIIRGYVKKKKAMGKADAVMILVLVVLSLVYLGFTIFVDSEVTRAWYLLLGLMGASVFMQLIRNGIAVWTCNERTS